MTHKTLLLTPWYFPVKILRWQDAVKMRYEGVADVVAEYGDEIRSPSVTWRVPAVLRLRKMPKASKRDVKFSRLNVYQRDGYRCAYCGSKFPVSELSYDHVVPRSAGGRTGWENIVTACRPCNLRKGNKTCDEAGMWPRVAPYRPKSLPLTGPVIDVATAPAEWHGFVAGVP
jgi:5-methylcytosine-specific restriction endonuclease McrA